MAPPPKSNIRAFVHWREPAVYAGEEIECIITFKNIALAPRKEAVEQINEAATTPKSGGGERSGGFGFGLRRSSTAAGSKRGDATTPGPAPQSRRASIVQAASRAPSIAGSRAVSGAGKGHRPALSLNVVSATSKSGMRSAPLPQGRFNSTHSAVQPIRGHGRSLSIMSMGSEARSDVKNTVSSSQGADSNRRPGKAHLRSASLQYGGRPPLQQAHGGSFAGISSRQPSPLYESSSPPAVGERQNSPVPVIVGRRRPGTVSANNTPQLGRDSSAGDASQPGTFNEDFQFPQHSQAPVPKEKRPWPVRTTSATPASHSRENASRGPQESWPTGVSNLNPISRVMSESSVSGTPRNSSDFYSMSNHSDDTLTSEAYTHQRNDTATTKQSLISASTGRPPGEQQVVNAEPETLMMGYVQTIGSFTLDGSLINAAPFEEVKRKGVQGGGGVVGVERPKRASGMFGALSWSNIGESLGGLLGNDEMSSMAQMKASAASRDIPLLSTPQSLLFVDLKLGPGESRSYSYRMVLPRGLPPTHRGRAIKIYYHLSIGVQRPDTPNAKHAKAPFRILGSYDSRGQSLGHDLMSPYVILQDAAKTQNITETTTLPTPFATSLKKRSNKNTVTPKEGLEDFLRYTERLLTESADTGEALLSPSSPLPASPSISRRQSTVSLRSNAPASTQDTVDLAILHSNQTKSHLATTQPQDPQVSGNRFNIARSGQPVAVLTILRPAFRLGEAVIGTIDFAAIHSPSSDVVPVSVYGVVIELESVEVIDPALSLRSNHSIHRVTRRVHAFSRENVAFARVVSFNLAIPADATPGFETTGVSLQWSLKIEFIVRRQSPQGLGIETSADSQGLAGGLLEELAMDDRGTAYIARERLAAETFEVKVPIKVYGARAGTEEMSGASECLEV